MKCGRKSHESADECNKQYKPRKALDLDISKIVTDALTGELFAEGQQSVNGSGFAPQ